MGILKIQAMFGQIAQAFVFVPRKFHEWNCMYNRCICREGLMGLIGEMKRSPRWSIKIPVALYSWAGADRDAVTGVLRR